MRNFIYILLVCFCTNWCSAQLQNALGINLEVKRGFLFAHREEMTHVPQELTYGVDLGVVYQTDGSKEWHEKYNYPILGLNFSFLTTGNKDMLGNAYSLTFASQIPLSKSKIYPSFNPQVGLGYVDNIYDVEDYPKNNTIGSHLNICVSLGFGLNYRQDKNLVGLGFEFKHFSNGASKLPNLGLNWPYLKFNYTRYFKSFKKADQFKKDVVNSSWRHSILGVFSVKEIYPLYEGVSPVFSLSYSAFKQFSKRSGFDLYLDLVSNNSLNRDVIDKESFWEQMQIGVYADYVQVINKLELFAGMGVYVKNSRYSADDFYHRLGARYRISNRLYGHFAIKSNWGRADYFEYGLSYKLNAK